MSGKRSDREIHNLEEVRIRGSYYIVGKVEGMDRFQYLRKDSFVRKRVRADRFFVADQKDKKALLSELAYLRSQGEFKLIEIGEWPV